MPLTRTKTHIYEMTLLVYRWTWTYCPDFKSRVLYGLSQVQCVRSSCTFPSIKCCKEDAMGHCPDIPDCWGGCYLYIEEYDSDHNTLESITLMK